MCLLVLKVTNLGLCVWLCVPKIILVHILVFCFSSNTAYTYVVLLCQSDCALLLYAARLQVESIMIDIK